MRSAIASRPGELCHLDNPSRAALQRAARARVVATTLTRRNLNPVRTVVNPT
jgi:hypothetical protein